MTLDSHDEISPYGPPARLTRPRPPLVVPVDPVRGWELADRPRRLAALAALPLAALMSALALGLAFGATGAVQVLWLGLGPTLFYSLARVLRPEPRDPERTSRHLLASAATSFAVPVLAVLLLDDFGGSGTADDVVVSLGLLAFVLGVSTVVWGVSALAVRWFTTP